jgi:hypothetical protein
MNTVYTIQSTGTMCGLHLTGALFAPLCKEYWFSIPEQLNTCHPLLESNYIVPGEYASLKETAPYATKTTFDGICIPSGFHLKVYSAPNFSGELLLDQEGPAIINNYLSSYSGTSLSFPELGAGSYGVYQSIDLLWELEDANETELSQKYPGSVRYKLPLNKNMHTWQNGSMIVTTSLPQVECGPEIPPDFDPGGYDGYDNDCCFSDVSTIQVNFLP